MALAAGSFASFGCISTSGRDNLAVFDAVWKTVNDWYFDPTMSGLDWTAIRRDWRPRAAKAETQAALYLDVLVPILDQFDQSHVEVRPPGTLILPSDRSFRMPRQKPGPFFLISKADEAGMGAKLTWTGAAFVVEDVTFPGPSYDAGLRPGQQVRLTGFRLPNKRNREIKLTEMSSNRSITIRWLPKPPPPATAWRMLDNQTAYLRFNAFDQPSIAWAITAIHQSSAPGLVVDLRDNTGGLISEVAQLLSVFLPAGSEIGEFKTRKGDSRGKSLPSPTTFGGPLAILIGPRTASGGEMTAAALQHGSRAQLFGAKTAGAVLASQTFLLPDGGKLTVPFADYVSP